MPVEHIDPARSALVLIDLQRSVVGLDVAPHPADVVVANSVRLAEAFRAVGGLVVLVRVAFAADGRDALTPPTDAGPSRRQPVPGGSDIIEELADLGDVVVTKHNWGAFHGTDLDVQLRRRNIGTVVLAGIATNMGVESTARAAHEHGYAVVLVEDAMSSLDGGLHDMAVQRIFPLLGRVTTTDGALAALS